jgi:multiple sugar transport system permease protein
VQPLPVGLSYFNQSYGTDYPHLMAASIMAIVPALVVFLVGQRFIVRGIRMGAIKG